MASKPKKSGERLLQALFGTGLTDFDTIRTLVVVAHPDDETLGCGGTIQSLRDIFTVHVTSGAPIDRAVHRKRGFESRVSYSIARRRELARAMMIAGVPEQNQIWLGVHDGRTHLQLIGLVRVLSGLIRSLNPALIITHAYEGGHSDHDATAFAVVAAARVANCDCKIVEMPLYRLSNGGIVRQSPSEFPHAKQAIRLVLNSAEREKKTQMIQCFESQEHVVREFSITHEIFREMPAYDYSKPANLGRILYDRRAQARSTTALYDIFGPLNEAFIEALRVLDDRG